MWLGLTKDKIFDFPSMAISWFQYCFGINRDFGKLLPLAAWKWHGLRLLTRRRYHLWSPLPTLAVHLSYTSLPLHAEQFPGYGVAASVIHDKMNEYLGGNV